MPKSDTPITYSVRLTTTGLHWGGLRWWFVCPLVIAGNACERRVGKLYLPRGGQYYGCRHCYDLTYESCRDSRRWDKLWRTPEAERGMSTRDMKEILESNTWTNQFFERERRNAQRRQRRKAKGWR